MVSAGMTDLWLPQTIGAAILDGAINFGIATAMYRSQEHVTLWVLAENTIAGDMGVTTYATSAICLFSDIRD